MSVRIATAGAHSIWCVTHTKFFTVIHHCIEVVATLQDIGVLVHYLPPYSPDLNPIEEAFSKVKKQLQLIDPDENFDTETAVLASFATITPADCISWISHPGIY